jgi:hypothetical protein
MAKCTGQETGRPVGTQGDADAGGATAVGGVVGLAGDVRAQRVYDLSVREAVRCSANYPADIAEGGCIG